MPPENTGAETRDKSEQLSRDKWLAAALDVLRREGIGGVKIVPIARALGVTTGSFYWHFRDREDLLRSVLSYWAAEMTGTVVKAVEAAAEQAPEDKLLLLMNEIVAGHRADHEIAIRAWAAFDPAAARVVRKVDQQRLETVRGVLRELGFRGDDLEMRTRFLIAGEMGEPAMLVRESETRRRKLMRLRYRMLMRQ